jgi:hypothetical protein
VSLECGVRGCGEEIPHDDAEFCSWHWSLLPVKVQEQVVDARLTRKHGKIARAVETAATVAAEAAANLSRR